jgi:E3 ubiquitin-protein ligase HERC2
MALDPVSLSQFEFLGKLMGIAIRTGDPLALDLSSFFWKQLVLTPLESKDLFDIDVRVGELLKALSRQDPFDVIFIQFWLCILRGELVGQEGVKIVFTTKLSDNTEVELVPDGRNILVDASNVQEYVKLAEKKRLYESSKQIGAVRRGLASIVPIAVNIPWILRWTMTH